MCLFTKLLPLLSVQQDCGFLCFVEAFSFYVVLFASFPGSFLCYQSFLHTSLIMPMFQRIRHLDLLTLHPQSRHSSLPFLYLPHSHSFFPTKRSDAPSQFFMDSLETQFSKRGFHIDFGVSWLSFKLRKRSQWKQKVGWFVNVLSPIKIPVLE